MKKTSAIDATRRTALAFLVLFAATLAQGIGSAATADDGGEGNSGSGGSGSGSGSGGDGDDGGDDDDGGGNSGSGNSGSGNSASGTGKQDSDDVQAAVKNGDAVSLRRLLNFVKTNYGGSVINVELERKGKRYVYEVKLLTADNKLRVVKLDALKLTAFAATVY